MTATVGTYTPNQLVAILHAMGIDAHVTERELIVSAALPLTQLQAVRSAVEGIVSTARTTR